MSEELKSLIGIAARRMLDENGAEAIYRDLLIGYCNLRSEESQAALADHPTPHDKPERLLPGAKSAVAVFLPFKDWIVTSNRGGEWASREWADAYVWTNEMIERVATIVALTLQASSHDARVIRPTGEFSERTLSADWSHKLIGRMCGLGKYGIHEMLITPSGCAGRLASVITTAEFSTTRGHPGEPCGFLRDGSCRECIDACPVGAITRNGVNREVCYQYCLANEKRFPDLRSPIVCGKCASVRCSMGPC